MNKHIKLNLLFLFVISLLIPLPANAYAGPGSAIGILIIIITVILAFFSSVLIKLFNLIKMLFKKVNFRSKKKGTKNSSQNQRDIN
mgnify:CR=1 FL=1